MGDRYNRQDIVHPVAPTWARSDTRVRRPLVATYRVIPRAALATPSTSRCGTCMQPTVRGGIADDGCHRKLVPARPGLFRSGPSDHVSVGFQAPATSKVITASTSRT